MNAGMSMQAVSIGVALAASVCDLRARRIPNFLTLGAALIGVAVHTATGGLAGGGASLAGIGVGIALFLPLFALGGMGAGDVKLLAALGAWLGPIAVVWTALYAAIAGGLLAAVVALIRGYLRTAVTNVWSLIKFWRVAGIRPMQGVTLETSRSPRLPYALPITAGLLFTLWLH